MKIFRITEKRGHDRMVEAIDSTFNGRGNKIVLRRSTFHIIFEKLVVYMYARLS